MKTTLIAILAAAAVTVHPAAAPAHENYRVIGIITKVTPTLIAVRQKDGREFSMRMDSATMVRRDKEKEKLPLSALRPGLNVVVDASGDTIDDVLVSNVRIVPPPKTSSAREGGWR